MTGRPFLLSFDPAVLATRFAAPEREPEPADEPADATPEAVPLDMAQLRPLLLLIPAEDQDLFELHYVLRKVQTEIGAMFSMTQAGVSYRLDRIRQRLRFLSRWPGVGLTAEDVQRDLAPYFPEPTVRTLASYLVTSCQSVTARELGVSQGRVRHRVITTVAALDILSGRHPELARYHLTFAQLFEAGTILHRNAKY